MGSLIEYRAQYSLGLDKDILLNKIEPESSHKKIFKFGQILQLLKIERLEPIIHKESVRSMCTKPWTPISYRLLI